MKKYELTDETITMYGATLHRIRATREFSFLDRQKSTWDNLVYQTVKPGDLGGFIQSEDNLSDVGNCWISADGVVMGNARVVGRAHVDEATVVDNAVIAEDALVCGAARVEGDARITDFAIIDSGRVGERAYIGGHMRVVDHAYVAGDSTMTGSGVIASNRDHICAHFGGRYFTLYPDRRGYDRDCQLYARDNNWASGCWSSYPGEPGNHETVKYAAADAAPNDFVAVEITWDAAYNGHWIHATVDAGMMSQTAFRLYEPEIYKMLAPVAATVAAANEITVIRNRDLAWRDVCAILPVTEDASGWESYVKSLEEYNLPVIAPEGAPEWVRKIVEAVNKVLY